VATSRHPHCRTCAHPERGAIELQLAGGASISAVARQRGIAPHLLYRHWRHVPDERKASLIMGPVQREALAARLSEESSSVVDHFKAVRAGLYELYQGALAAADFNSGALLAGKLHENLNSVARLTGQLATSPLVQVNQQVNNYFLNDPNFARFQADLIRALSPFPDARAAILAAFERLEAAPVERPALEHQPDVAAA
jgi:hypothetical protein